MNTDSVSCEFSDDVCSACAIAGCAGRPMSMLSASSAVSAARMTVQLRDPMTAGYGGAAMAHDVTRTHCCKRRGRQDRQSWPLDRGHEHRDRDLPARISVA